MPGSWSAMIAVAPASARASTQARPIPRPPPVTSATRPGTLNFSRYIRPFASAQGLPLRVEPVDPSRIRSDPHRVPFFQAELTHGPGGDPVRRRDVDVEEGVAAEVFGGGHGAAPTL